MRRVGCCHGWGSTAIGGGMSELKVRAWRRYGHDRLYVTLPSGVAVAWMDRETGEITLLLPEHRAAATAVLAEYRQRPPSKSASAVPTPPLPGYTPLPALTTADDLALNRAGAAVREKLGTEGPGLATRAVDWALRRPSDWDSWRTGLTGERRVGAELARLVSRGWRVIHAVPLPRGVDIDHLLIGLGGVFSVNTKRHPGKAVWVGDEMVRVNHGPPHPYPRKSRAEARRVQKVLSRFCDFEIPVEPVLVFVGATEVVKVATLLDVRVYREREVSALGPLTGVLSAEQVERVYAVARHRQAWRMA